MTLLVDLSILAIVAFCTWRGYKDGLVRGVFGFAALIAALFIANIAATAYSDEFSGMLKPFIGGIVDTTLTDVIDESTDFDFEQFPDIDLDQLGANAPDFAAAYTALRQIGLPESSAARVAELAAAALDSEQGGAVRFLADSISDKLSSALAFVAVFGIAFLLLAIVITVIGNLVSLVFSLPGLKLIDIIAGSAFGFAKGLLIVFAIGTIVRYFGLFAHETLESTSILKSIVNSNPIANAIGI